MDATLKLQLQMDDLENRNRCNNIKLRGIPEATTGADLIAIVKGILNTYLDKPPESELELDRVHRVGPHTAFPHTGTRDVLCRVHFSTIKEQIMR